MDYSYYETLTFRQLQKEARELGIKKFRGKGIEMYTFINRAAALLIII